MKKLSRAVVVLSLAVFMSAAAHAGMGGGCANCVKEGAAPSDPYRKFQSDTIDLRQEMMIKRFDVQRENLKGTPDKAKIAALQADIRALQAKILEIRAASGLPADKCDGECSKKNSWCDKKGMGDCGKGNGMGGCATGPCGGHK